MKNLLLISVFVLSTAVISQAADLPSPQKSGGAPLMEALAKRSTGRVFDSKRELSQQQLSNLLWASYGINRTDGKRTAASAHNTQETSIYVLLKDGAFLYNPQKNSLEAISPEDIRALGGTQDFVKDASVTLVFVADLAKAAGNNPSAKKEVAAINVGAISQNAYLYCASEGLVTGARMSIDREKLGAKLKLKENHWIALAQSVGYEKK
ncbi:MAG: SagB/ThcOx family dehydrogenase [Puniceicoccales bacterium]|jgi:SagB-type dehydrogenase family enzyme|nr:SagB/ThcOx family dehydrogenase [Puniceicoccales bacterium]